MSYTADMIGAATSRRAGVRSAAAALVFALVAAAACGSLRSQPTAEKLPTSGTEHPRAQVDAAKPPALRVRLPRVRGGLPSPVMLRTSGGAYVVTRSGAIHRLASASPHIRSRVHHPAGFVWVNRHSGTWAMMRGCHLVIVRSRAVIWRSAARYAVRDAARMNVIVAGRPGVAFEVRPGGPLFVAGWHAAEHRAAAAAWPEMWTRSGNLIGDLHRPGSRTFGYAVFSPSGARLGTLATGLRVPVVDMSVQDLAAGKFWFLTSSGNIIRTDGASTKVVANTRALGLAGVPAVGAYRGGLIQLLSTSWRQGQVILYPDGQVFARIPPPPRGQVAGFGELSVSPGRRAVAWVLTREPGNASTVFVVRPGGAPEAVYGTPHGSSPCGRVPLAWHGSWLLYTHHAGGAVLIDTAGSHRIIRLPATLPGSNGQPVPVDRASWL